MKETILYGVKIQDPDHLEEILYIQKGYVNTEKLMEDSIPLAKEKGYNRLRISVIDLAEKPNFADKKLINI